MSQWFHRTCEHRHPLILRTMTLQPQPHPILRGLPLVWLTSSPSATRVMLGLSSNTLECDRMSHLFRVVPEDEDKVVPWSEVMRSEALAPFLPGIRQLVAVRGTRPALWGISSDPLRVEQVT